MFISAAIRLDVSFNAAQAKLADLTRGGLLGRASGGAYDHWQAGLARVGPWRSTLGMSRLARVHVRDLVTNGDPAIWAMRWEVAGRRGVLVPALDADIKLTPAGEDATLLTVSAVCRMPLAGLGAGLDPAVMHQVAQATIQAFTNQVATAIMDPVASPDAGHSSMRPEPAHRVRQDLLSRQGRGHHRPDERAAATPPSMQLARCLVAARKGSPRHGDADAMPSHTSVAQAPSPDRGRPSRPHASATDHGR
jgi:hypothetical protein